MFFLMPFWSIITCYLVAAVLPGYLLLRYVYNQDKVEQEDPRLLMRLLRGGFYAALVAIVLEAVGNAVLDVSLDRSSPFYALALAFLVVAVVEEGAKFFFLYRYTWYNPQFDYRFDGVVYAVFVSMGFAIFENVKYVFGNGLSVALPRALLSVPAHMGFAVFMGVLYGEAKIADVHGRKTRQHVLLALSYLSSVLLHGFYDACLMVGTGMSMACFAVFVVLMYVIVWRMIRHASSHDKPVWA